MADRDMKKQDRDAPQATTSEEEPQAEHKQRGREEQQAILNEKRRRELELKEEIRQNKARLQTLKDLHLQQEQQLESLRAETDTMVSQLMDQPGRNERLKYLQNKAKIQEICESFAHIVGESVKTDDPFKQLEMIHKFLHITKALRANHDAEADEPTDQ